MSSVDISVGSSQSRLGVADDRPLTDQEYQMVQRLLADPFSFPLAFKTWLISYLETSDLTLPIAAVQGLSALLGISITGSGTLGILPAGIILPYGGLVSPTGALLCDGASYLKTEQSRLYNAIGTTYGSVDAAHFSVPDMVGRGAIMLGQHADVNALGKHDGLAAALRSPIHDTTLNDPGHSHTPNLGDPGHNHGVSDGGHSHGANVNDPGHSHTAKQPEFIGAGGQMGGTGNLNYSGVQGSTSTSGAGISVGIDGSGANVGVDGAGTGMTLSINGSFTGMNAGPRDVGRPVDRVPFLVVNAIIVN